MKSFPMFITMAGRRVVIVGGGEQAAQKMRLMLKTDAEIVIAAPELDDELRALVRTGRAAHYTGPITPDLFRDTALVFIGSGCPAVDVCAHSLAKAASALVNVVDQPDLCDATTPSIVDRDPVVVAIGTEGTAPVLGRAIKTDIEKMLDPRLGSFAALAGRLRNMVSSKVAKTDRRDFWRWVFNDAPWTAFKRGAEREAATIIKDAIEGGHRATGGLISLIDAGPGDRDLLTLRAVERLQEADIIYYDQTVNTDVLELARRDAERVCLTSGNSLLTHSGWSDELLISEARKGNRTVRLFAQSSEWLEHLSLSIQAETDDCVPIEVIAGVSKQTRDTETGAFVGQHSNRGFPRQQMLS